MVRVVSQSDIVFWKVPYLDWESFIKTYALFFASKESKFTGFGGGQFGGGGATRSWEEATQDQIESSIEEGLIAIIRGEE